MKTNNEDKLHNLEKAWTARQISESDYLMWKKVYSGNNTNSATERKTTRKSRKN